MKNMNNIVLNVLIAALILTAGVFWYDRLNPNKMTTGCECTVEHNTLKPICVTFTNGTVTFNVENTSSKNGVWFLDKDGVLTHISHEGKIYKLNEIKEEKKNDSGKIGSAHAG